jgi:hypothetical protein
LNGCILVLTHEAAVTHYISTENGDEFALETFFCHMAPPKLRFQTVGLSMWIIRRNAVLSEHRDSLQQLESRFKSGGMAYLILINKSMGFSQSLSGVLADCDTIWQKPTITQVEIH